MVINGRVSLSHCYALSPPNSSLSLSFLINRLFFFIHVFIYLFLAALGLRCCAQAFSGCSERGPLFIAVRGLLIVVASLVVEHGL